MDNKAVRKRNIEWLVEQHGGPTAFGNAIEREQSQVSQWLGEKPIGDKLARHIEAKLRKPTGWLDLPQWKPRLGEGLEALLRVSQPPRLNPETIAITTRALHIILRRRDPKATLNLENIEDAALFAAVYAEAEGNGDELALGAVVADLVAEREARRGRNEGKQVGGVDRGKAGRKTAGK